jgi:hypothetical protein
MQFILDNDIILNRRKMTVYISPAEEYPLYYGDVERENPGWQLGQPLPEGWHEVAEVIPPEFSNDQVLEQLAPVKIDGIWTQQWLVRDMTPEEIETRDAPVTAKQKLLDLGLTEKEISALFFGFLR